jgi:ABC-type uncharacterized transport system YnjBCD ATPase subunit
MHLSFASQPHPTKSSPHDVVSSLAQAYAHQQARQCVVPEVRDAAVPEVAVHRDASDLMQYQVTNKPNDQCVVL